MLEYPRLDIHTEIRILPHARVSKVRYPHRDQEIPPHTRISKVRYLIYTRRKVINLFHY